MDKNLEVLQNTATRQITQKGSSDIKNESHRLTHGKQRDKETSPMKTLHSGMNTGERGGQRQCCNTDGASRSLAAWC